MPEITAAAELGYGTFPVHPVGRFFQDLRDLAGSPGLLGLLDPDADLLTSHGIGDEYGAAFDVSHALAFGSIIRDHGFVDFIFDQHKIASFTLTAFYLITKTDPGKVSENSKIRSSSAADPHKKRGEEKMKKKLEKLSTFIVPTNCEEKKVTIIKFL